MDIAVAERKPVKNAVEDVQSGADTRQIAINRVGIKDIRHPVRVKDRSAGEQHTVATFNMYVNLPHNFKGTHMSRFVEILHHEREISVDSFRDMLVQMATRLDADAGHIEMAFPYFVSKRAPVSGVESLMDYQAALIGESCHGETTLWVRVVVPVTSLCPCSKKISERGAHNQRSHVTIKARLRAHTHPQRAELLRKRVGQAALVDVALVRHARQRAPFEPGRRAPPPQQSRRTARSTTAFPAETLVR